MNSGKVKVSLKLGFLPLPGKTFDLCELLEDAGESCPVEEGKFSIKLALEIPRATPGVSRHYTAVGLNGGCFGRATSESNLASKSVPLIYLFRTFSTCRNNYRYMHV